MSTWKMVETFLRLVQSLSDAFVLDNWPIRPIKEMGQSQLILIVNECTPLLSQMYLSILMSGQEIDDYFKHKKCE